MRSPVQRLTPELYAQIEDAVDENLISDSQRARITQTDLIIRAQRKSDRAWIWIAVEASISIHRDDIDRARQSAQALTAAFGEPAVPVAVGQRIDPPETHAALWGMCKCKVVKATTNNKIKTSITSLLRGGACKANGIHKRAGLLFATSGIKSAVAWFSCVVASWTEGRWEHHHSRRAL